MRNPEKGRFCPAAQALGAKTAGLLFLAMTIGLALACGSGGGGASGSAAPEKSLRLKFKPSELYNVRAGDVFTVTELGGQHVALPKTALSGESFQTLEVEFKPGFSYVFAVYSSGVPFVRTVVTASQISAAKSAGVLNVGELNGLTTYFTGLVEVALSGARMQAGSNAEQAVQAMLQKHFSGAGSFADLSIERIKSGALPTTDSFKQQVNRINILTLYLEQVGAVSAPLSASQASAMGELFAAIFDTASANNLLSKLSSPALPPFRPANAALASGRSFLDEVSEQFIADPGSLGKNELAAVFWEPTKNPQLAFSALHSRGLGGKVTGNTKAGVSVELRNADDGRLLQTGVSTQDGSYFFEGLAIGKYRVKPSLSGHVFKPSSYTIDLDEDLRDAGFNFTSFVFLKGSTAVPKTAEVLSGIQYTSEDGQTALSGSLQLPKASEVKSGATFGPEGSLKGTREDPPSFYIGTSTSASFVIDLQ